MVEKMLFVPNPMTYYSILPVQPGYMFLNALLEHPNIARGLKINMPLTIGVLGEKFYIRTDETTGCLKIKFDFKENEFLDTIREAQ